MFIVALVFNILSSYLLASINKSVLVLFVAFFAFVVLNMEILSLFSAINEINLLIFSNNIKVKEKNLAKKFHKIIKKELKKGTIKKENIENSYQKIIQLKNSLL